MPIDQFTQRQRSTQNQIMMHREILTEIGALFTTTKTLIFGMFQPTYAFTSSTF